jgi:hypothetical protein
LNFIECRSVLVSSAHRLGSALVNEPTGDQLPLTIPHSPDFVKEPVSDCGDQQLGPLPSSAVR